MNKQDSRTWIMLLAFWLGCLGAFSPSAVSAATTLPFEQGAGYQAGAYDRDAVQPTAFNWTRQSRFKGSANVDKIKWLFETGGWVYTSPAIGSDGTIYIGSEDGKVYALDPDPAATERVKWSFQTGDWVQSSPAIGSDGTIYIGSWDGQVYALNPDPDAINRVKWSFALGDPIAPEIYTSPAIGSDGTIYIVSGFGKVFALEPDPVATQRVKWSYDTNAGWGFSSPAIGKDGTIYIGSWDGRVFALDPDPAAVNRVKWSDLIGVEIGSSPVIGSDGTIYIGSSDKKVYALDPDPAATQRIKWSYETGGKVLSSPAIGTDGTIYIGSNDGRVYAIDPNPAATQRVKWSYKTGSAVRSPITIGLDGTIYVGSWDGRLYALDSDPNSMRRVKWSFETQYGINASPAIGSDGTIYFGSQDGMMYAIGAKGPDIPTNLQATPDAGKVILNWEAAGRAESYKVFKADPANPIYWVLVNDTELLTEPTYTVEGLTGGNVYWFVVKAVNSGGESDYSIPASATPYTLVTMVEPLDRIRVAKGIKLSELALPTEARVQLADGSEIRLSIDWNLANSDYDAEQVGMYTVTGELQLPGYIQNPQHKKVEVSVIVMPNTNARLSSIELNGARLPGFKSEVFNYSIRVPFATEQVSVMAATYDPQATYEVSGGTNHHLQVGNNRIGIIVTAEDEAEQMEYTINVERERDGEAPWWPSGSKLTLSDITHTSVKLSWSEAKDNVAVAGYRLYLNGDKQMDEASSFFEHSLTDNVYSYTMTGLVPGTTYDFTVTAYDAENNESDPGLSGTAMTLSHSSSGIWYSLSDNAELKTLEIWAAGNSVPLTPTFIANTLSYTAETEAEQVELKAFPEHKSAKVTWQDQALVDGITIDLQVGENVLELIVQAEDGTKKIYTVTIQRAAVCEATFSDISGHWARSSIEEATAKCIVRGYPDGTFRPNNPVTRAEFTVLLTGALKLSSEGTVLAFTDHELIDPWAKQAVAQAVQEGIITGYNDGSFRPNAYITRSEMAVMIARAFKLSYDAHSATGFVDDNDIPQWAQGAVAALQALGIIIGHGDNRFIPDEQATRAEAAVLLLRMLDIDK